MPTIINTSVSRVFDFYWAHLWRAFIHFIYDHDQSPTIQPSLLFPRKISVDTGRRAFNMVTVMCSISWCLGKTMANAWNGRGQGTALAKNNQSSRYGESSMRKCKCAIYEHVNNHTRTKIHIVNTHIYAINAHKIGFLCERKSERERMERGKKWYIVILLYVECLRFNLNAFNNNPKWPKNESIRVHTHTSARSKIIAEQLME